MHLRFQGIITAISFPRGHISTQNDTLLMKIPLEREFNGAS